MADLSLKIMTRVTRAESFSGCARTPVRERGQGGPQAGASFYRTTNLTYIKQVVSPTTQRCTENGKQLRSRITRYPAELSSNYWISHSLACSSPSRAA